MPTHRAAGDRAISSAASSAEATVRSFTHSPWSGCPLLARNCCGTRGQEQGVLNWRVAACLLAIAISCASSVSPSACANCSSSSQMGQCPLGASLGRRPRSSEGMESRAFAGGCGIHSTKRETSKPGQAPTPIPGGRRVQVRRHEHSWRVPSFTPTATSISNQVCYSTLGSKP